MDSRDALERAYEDVWDTFRTVGKTQPAFGTRSSEEILHLVFLLPVGHDPTVRGPIAAVQQRLDFPYTDIVPADRLHVSIQGFDAQPSEWGKRREEVLGPARTVFSRYPAFTMRLGRLNSFPMAAFLRADDGGIIRQLRADLRAALPAWAGLDRDPMVSNRRDIWLPHLSLAYYNADHDNRALVDAIAPLRKEAIAEIHAQEIHLISTPPHLAGADRWVWPLHARFELDRAG